MKLLCDQMLGTCAKWLRILGIDTFFDNSEMDDKEILKIAKKEDRTLITRDKDLLIDARRENISVIKIETTDLDEQLRTVLKEIEIDKSKILSRCILCNSKVVKIDKEKVKDKVPQRVFENNHKFWYCSKCDKLYWRGTHTENMIKKISEM